MSGIWQVVSTPGKQPGYQWNDGDAFQAVADFFGAEPGAILEYPSNWLDYIETDLENSSISPGTWVIIPGGRRALRDWGPPARTRANPAAAKLFGSGYCGEIYQGASGVVVFSGWSEFGYGYLIVLDHGNGWQSADAHL